MQEQTERVPKKNPKRKLARRRKRPGKKQELHAYPPEFRLRAVLMHSDNGLSQAEVSRQLGISPNTLVSAPRGTRSQAGDRGDT